MSCVVETTCELSGIFMLPESWVVTSEAMSEVPGANKAALELFRLESRVMLIPSGTEMDLVSLGIGIGVLGGEGVLNP